MVGWELKVWCGRGTWAGDARIPALATTYPWAKLTLREGKEAILLTQEAAGEQEALHTGSIYPCPASLHSIPEGLLQLVGEFP